MSGKVSQPQWTWWKRWENVVLLVTGLGWSLMAAYLAVHFATSTVVHDEGFCCGYRTHSIAGRRVPRWVDTQIFWLAWDIEDRFRQ